MIPVYGGDGSGVHMMKYLVVASFGLKHRRMKGSILFVWLHGTRELKGSHVGSAGPFTNAHILTFLLVKKEPFHAKIAVQ